MKIIEKYSKKTKIIKVGEFKRAREKVVQIEEKQKSSTYGIADPKGKKKTQRGSNNNYNYDPRKISGIKRRFISTY